jgi:putative ABC transport system ATP-binding protein
VAQTALLFPLSYKQAFGRRRVNHLVTAEAVSRSFPLDHNDVLALDEVSLHVEAGEFLAIAGPSGSGKTTLLNLVGCIDKPTSGRIWFDGDDTTKLTSSQTTVLRRKKIGFVFQTFNLIPVFTASENVEFPLLVQGVSCSERRRRAQEALESVGLASRAAHRPDLLSGGERQRVAVARAIVHKPALVLADEPTANLDTQNATQLIDLMRELNQNLGLTFIFSTHDQRLLERTPRIVRLCDGRVVSDTHDAAPMHFEIPIEGDRYGQVSAARVS